MVLFLVKVKSEISVAEINVRLSVYKLIKVRLHFVLNFVQLETFREQKKNSSLKTT